MLQWQRQPRRTALCGFNQLETVLLVADTAAAHEKRKAVRGSGRVTWSCSRLRAHWHNVVKGYTARSDIVAEEQLT